MILAERQLKNLVKWGQVILKFGSGQMICSALTALPYRVELGTLFEGKLWRWCIPNGIGDHVPTRKEWLFTLLRQE